jgi:hypothetical protein
VGGKRSRQMAHEVEDPFPRSTQRRLLAASQFCWSCRRELTSQIDGVIRRSFLADHFIETVFDGDKMERVAAA